MQADLVLTNVGQLVGITNCASADDRADLASGFQSISGGSIAVHEGRIVWVGLASELPDVSRHC